MSFVEGVELFVQGARAARRPGLARYIWAPALLSLAIIAGGLILAYAYTADLAAFLSARLPAYLDFLSAILTPLVYLTSVLIWGTTWYAIKLQLGVVPIEWSLIYRFVLAVVLLFGLCQVTGRRLRFGRADHVMFAGLGVFLFSTNYYLSYLGVEYLTSGLVAVLFSTLTIMNIINAAIFLKRPMAPSLLVGALAGLTGLALVFWPEVGSLELGGATLTGIGIGLLAPLSASFGGTLAATQRIKSLPIIQVNAWGMLYGVGLTTIATLASGSRPVWDPSPVYSWALVYLAVFGTVIAFIAYLKLIARAGPERAGYMAVGFPIVALLVSTLFEDFVWTLPAVAGVALVLGGNVLVLRQPKAKTVQRVEEAADSAIP